jgi:hypothetical protein
MGSCLSLLAAPANPSASSDALVWRGKGNRVDAQIEGWTLPRLLEELAAATGWQIYLEPGTEATISTKFKNLSASDALRRLLGQLNYALLPQTNAPANLFVYQTSVQEATQLIRPLERLKTASKSSQHLGNELIVTLKAGSREKIDDLARRLGAKVTGQIDGLNAYRLQFENDAAAKNARDLLSTNPDWEADYNYVLDRPTRIENLSFSSLPQSFKLKPKAGGDSSRVVIGLIDTAVQQLGAGMDDFLLPPLTVAGDAAPPNNRPTHGTSMSETILNGVAMAQEETGATTVRILPVDVYGKNGATTTFDLAAGIYAAINAGANVINLSMGGEADSAFLHRLIQQGYEQGVLFVGAAGNEPSTAPTFPAAYPEVIAVTAGDKRGNIAPYANRGSFIDVIAPGTSIVYFKNQAYLVSGTSASTAYVSGLAAGLAANSGKSLREVETKLREALGVNAASKPASKP